MNRRVYIAGPISNGHTANAKTVYNNVKTAEKYYYELIRAGWTPFLPHLSYYPWLDFPTEHDVHWARWIELDLDWIDSSCALIRIPGESIGADTEVKYATDHNIPVIYASSPQNAVTTLTALFGSPKQRVELAEYLEMIKVMKKT